MNIIRYIHGFYWQLSLDERRALVGAVALLLSLLGFVTLRDELGLASL